MMLAVIGILAVSLLLSNNVHGFHEKKCLSDLHCLSGLPQRLAQVLGNKHLVMIGDSLSRYQYISLAYMLTHRNILSPDMHPSIVNEHTWKNWNEYYIHSNGILGPYEVCDCDRDENMATDNIFENRFYRDQVRNISVSFFCYMGRPTSTNQGRLFLDDINSLTGFQGLVHNSSNKWIYRDLPSFVNNIVVKLKPKPDFVVLNYGRWQHGIRKEHRRSMLSTLKGNNVSFVWKTTSYGFQPEKGDLYSETSRYVQDQQVIMNTSWTKGIDKSFFWDIRHFNEPVYSVLNYQLCEVLSGLL